MQITINFTWMVKYFFEYLRFLSTILPFLVSYTWQNGLQRKIPVFINDILRNGVHYKQYLT